MGQLPVPFERVAQKGAPKIIGSSQLGERESYQCGGEGGGLWTSLTGYDIFGPGLKIIVGSMPGVAACGTLHGPPPHPTVRHTQRAEYRGGG